jgi:glyoxalase family protein
MPDDVPGIHHVTAIASDPGENLSFYTNTLGLRLVKRSVNQDDVSVYHLFYADHEGSPGTSMTFFPYTGAREGLPGRGQVTTTAFLIPADSVDFWTDRLAEAGVDAEPTERFGDPVVAFEDPDGLQLELVAREDAPPANLPDAPVPEAHAVRGFFGVTLSLASTDPTANLLQAMGYEETTAAHGRTRFESSGDLGSVVDLCEDPQAPQGTPGAGTVHHVAFRTTEADHADWRDVLFEQGLRPTEVIDRTWFESIYVREQGGVLFEFATEGPGYTVDEDLDALGERLVLPEWLEDRREEIEDGLPPLEAAPEG